MTQVTGIFLILLSIGILIYWLFAGKRNKPLLRFVCQFIAILGLLLILKDKLVEVTFKDWLSIKTSAAMATADAKTISDIKQQVVDQRATIDLVATEAQTAKNLSGEASNKIAVAEQKLSYLDGAIQKANDSFKKLDAANTTLQAQIEQTSNNVAKIDPLTQRAQSAKATIFLWTEGTNVFHLAHDLNALVVMSSKLAFGSPKLMKAGAPTLFSPFPRMLPPSLDGTNLRWKINFERDDDVFSDRDLNINVSEAINWGKFEIGAPFLPVGTKISKVQIILTVNNNTSTNITIGNLTIRDSSDLRPFWDDLTNGVEIFNETNGYNWFSR